MRQKLRRHNNNIVVQKKSTAKSMATMRDSHLKKVSAAPKGLEWTDAAAAGAALFPGVLALAVATGALADEKIQGVLLPLQVAN